MITDCANCDQCKFDQVSIPNYHEIHVTVETDDVNKFVNICNRFSIKPIVIEFQKDLVATKTHVMTSQPVNGNDDDALDEMMRICNVLNSSDFRVVRRKIEVSIFNQRDDYSQGYFESHLSFKIKLEDKPKLEKVASKIGDIRISRNALKVVDNYATIMATKRVYNTNSDSFYQQMLDIQKQFEYNGFKSDKLILEFCWFDDATSLDNEWKTV